MTAAAGRVLARTVDAARARGPIEPPTYWLVHLASLEVEEHRYLPDPQCDACGSLADDAPEDPGIGERRLAKPISTLYRTRDVGAEIESLERKFVDPESGLIRSLNPSTIGRTVVAGAPLRVRGVHGFEPGFGRASTYRASRVTALLEGLERYAAANPGRRRTVVRASWAEAAADAIDPRALGLPRRTGGSTGYLTFTPDVPLDWVWGWSLTQARPRLVPEDATYYALAARSGPRLLDDFGSGCAVGSGIEEAILHAVWELVERDGLLLAWQTRMAVPELDLMYLGSETAMVAAGITAETGFRVRVFDTTMEHGIPSVWTVATTPTPETGPQLICAGGAGATAAEAARRAVIELAPMVHVVREHFDSHAADAARMARDATKVREMTHHYLVNASLEARGRMSFLLDQAPGAPRADPIGLACNDLRDDLTRVVGMLDDVGLETVVVDQTPPELLAASLSCAKVIVPGLVPLTFGYERARHVGLDRMRRVPHLLGYSDRPLRDEDLHDHPHPFP